MSSMERVRNNAELYYLTADEPIFSPCGSLKPFRFCIGRCVVDVRFVGGIARCGGPIPT